MTDFSADKLRALDAASTESMDNFLALNRYLREQITAILAMAEDNRRLREALKRVEISVTAARCLLAIDAKDDAERHLADAVRVAVEALGEEKAS